MNRLITMKMIAKTSFYLLSCVVHVVCSGPDTEQELQESKWPAGPYALPIVKDGCPESQEHGWEVGYINFTTTEPMFYVSSTARELSLDSVSMSNGNNPFGRAGKSNMIGPFGNFSYQLNFCYKSENHRQNKSVYWPQGKYSIYGSKNGCPKDFSEYTLALSLPSILYWNRDGHLPAIEIVMTRDGKHELHARLCKRYSDNNDKSNNNNDNNNSNNNNNMENYSIPVWSTPYMLVKNHDDDCPDMEGVTSQTEYLIFETRTDGTDVFFEDVGYCYYSPKFLKYGNVSIKGLEHSLLSKGKSAFVSSYPFDLPFADADKIIDGNINNYFYDGSCLHTGSQYEPWWMVDLEGIYLVESVIVYNRPDCCGSLPHRLELSMGTSVNTLKVHGFTENEATCAYCKPVFIYPFASPVAVRYIKLQIRDSTREHVLHVCGVEVYGYRQYGKGNCSYRCLHVCSFSYVDPELKNVAYRKLAYQSSTMHAFAEAYTAVDGDTNSDMSQQSCVQTREEIEPWWLVDLHIVYIIDHVIVYNRRDCCSERLHNLELSMGLEMLKLSPVGFLQKVKTFGHFSIKRNTQLDVSARFVKIQIKDSSHLNVLHFCEIEIYGYKQNPKDLENISLNKPAKQSSITGDDAFFRNMAEDNSRPEKAVDGIKHQSWVQGDCTYTDVEPTPWWIVDLGSVNVIEYVVIYNRNDCCWNMLRDVYISMGSTMFGMREYAYFKNDESPLRIVNITISDKYEVLVLARFVKFHIDDGNDFNVLSLCEVEVFGYMYFSNELIVESKDGTPIEGVKITSSPQISAMEYMTIDQLANIDEIPWLMFDLQRSLFVNIIKGYLRTVLRNVLTDSDYPYIYVSDTKWNFLQEGGITCRYNTYTDVFTTVVHKCIRAIEGRYVSLVGKDRATHGNMLEYFYRIVTVDIYTDRKRDDSSNVDFGMANETLYAIQTNASSWLNNHPPYEAKFSGKSWCPAVSDHNPYLQVDLLSEYTVEGITIFNNLVVTYQSGQSAFSSTIFGCGSFIVRYGTSLDAIFLYDEKPFHLDSSRPYEEPQTFNFLKVFLARFVRLYPEPFSQTENACMRIKLFGSRITGKDGVVDEDEVDTAVIVVEDERLLTITTDHTEIRTFAQTRKWEIRFDKDTFIRLVFSKISLNVYQDCYEYIAMSAYKGDSVVHKSSQSKHIYYIDHLLNGKTPVISTNISTLYMTVLTCSRVASVVSGMEVYVKKQENPSCFALSKARNTVCHQSLMNIISDSFGGIPNLENEYQTWKIIGHNNGILVLNITDFEVRCDSGSDFELSKWLHNYRWHIDHHCTRNKPMSEIQLSDGHLQIRFFYSRKSDLEPLEGFSGIYKTIAKEMLLEMVDFYQVALIIKDYFDGRPVSIYKVCSSAVNTCYNIHWWDKQLSWKDANKNCLSQDNRLATINTRAEMQLLSLALQNMTFFLIQRHFSLLMFKHVRKDPLFYAHIGLFRQVDEGGVVHEQWVDSSAYSFKAWNSNEPKDIAIKKCTRMAFYMWPDVNTWESENCDETGRGGAAFTICESTRSHIKAIALTNRTGSNAHKPAVQLEPALFHQCNSGEWISVLVLCDGLAECIDGSDETECQDKKGCTEESFHCAEGRCLHINQVCDFNKDCENGEDEYCDLQSGLKCFSDEYKCDNYQCVPERLYCDGIKDCVDGSDETQCAFCHGTHLFRCDNRTCIPKNFVCNNVKDCVDGSDEMFCDQTFYHSCSQIWEDENNNAYGLYNLGGQMVECNFSKMMNESKTTLAVQGVELLEQDYVYNGRKFRFVELYYTNLTFVKELINNKDYTCEQTVYRTCRPDSLEVAKYIENLDLSVSRMACDCVMGGIRRTNGTTSIYNILCDVSSQQSQIVSPNMTLIDFGEQPSFFSFSFPIDDDASMRIVVQPLQCEHDYRTTEITNECNKTLENFNMDIFRCLYQVGGRNHNEKCQPKDYLQNCEMVECPHNFIKCPGSYCIPVELLCDDQKQCPEGEDEVTCACGLNRNNVAFVYYDSFDGDIPFYVYKLTKKFQYTPHKELIITLGFSAWLSNTGNPRTNDKQQYGRQTKLTVTQRVLNTQNSNSINPADRFMTAAYVTEAWNVSTAILQFFNLTWDDRNSTIIYIQDGAESKSLLPYIIAGHNQRIRDKSVYLLVQNKSITKKVEKTFTSSSVTQLQFRSWEDLGTLAHTLFPDTCAAPSKLSICPGHYRCSASRMCLPLTKVCDGEKNCLLGDDESSCYFECPKKCTCIAFRIDCSHKNFLVTDLQSVPISTRILKLDNNPGVFNNINRQDGVSVTFPFLVRLNLSMCGLEELVNDTFYNIRNLENLDLSRNKIKSIPSYMFSVMRSLNTLNLNRNKGLMTIERNAFFGLSKLRYLYLRHTQIIKLSKNIFKGLQLKSLDVSSSIIQTVEELALSDLGVEHINLEFINIQSFAQGIFAGVHSVKTIQSSAVKFCCIRPNYVQEENCLPRQDEFSSCADLMRNPTLKTLLWVIGIAALIGNSLSLVHRLFLRKDVRVKSFSLYVKNLAVADFLMGVYLITIAVADLAFRDRYSLEDEYWRGSHWCTLAGILSTMSSEASVLFISLITLDRFIVIKYPFGKYRIKYSQAVVLSLLCWSISLVIATVPLMYTSYFRDKFYTKHGVCLALPLSRDRSPGWQYSVTIFIGLNFVMFCMIAVGQILIYTNASKGTRELGNSMSRRRNDMRVARNLLLVVITDFMCWFPIGCVGIAALSDHVISGDVYAWIAVLVLPINSALNPFLYTLTELVTKHCHFKKNGRNKVPTPLPKRTGAKSNNIPTRDQE